MPHRTVWLVILGIVQSFFIICPAASVGIESGSLAGSDETVKMEFNITRTPAQINIDGVLDEPAWELATNVPLPYEVFPGNNIPARVETTCFLAYDDENLYFAFIASDPNPAEVRAYISDRDDIQNQDRVALILDPFNDTRRAFDFTVTALGVQYDGVFDQQRGGTDGSWDAIWESAGRTTSDGFTVEAAIPFKSIRFPSTNGVQTWGFFAQRIQPRSKQYEMRSMPLDRNNSCQLCQINKLTGFHGISPGANLEVIPSATASRTDRLEELSQPDLDTGAFKGEPALDLRWSPTTNLALNATIDPDFSQIEADVAQLDVNNRFALFFPEKRPFFLEGADFFNTRLPAVFTRTIAEPIAGGKVTGKLGTSVVGILAARDRITNLLFPGRDGSASESLEEAATTLIGRYRRDVGSSSTVGALYTGRKGRHYANHMAGFDGFLRPGKSVTLQFQYMHSETNYPDSIVEEYEQPSGRFAGDALDIYLRYTSRDWNINSRYRSLSNSRK